MVLATIFVYYISQGLQRNIQTQVNESIRSELLALSDQYSQGGVNRLIRSIELRTRQPGALLFLVTDFSGNPIVGNIGPLTNSILNQSSGNSIQISYQRIPTYSRFVTNSATNENEDEKGQQAIVRILELENKFKFVIGRDISESVHFVDTLNRTLRLTLIAMIVAAILGWFYVGKRGLKRINSVSETSNKLMLGRLDERIQTTGSGDEFDRLANTVNGMLDRIQDLRAGVNDVTDSISHDLRTPLTRMRGKLESTLRKDDSIESYRETAKDTLAEADNLIKLFDALMRIARLEDGSDEYELENIKVEEIVEEIAEFYEPIIEDQEFKFTLANVEPVEVTGSRELLSQAIINLLDNALKYGHSDDGTTGSITVSLTKTKTHAEISVADSGIGIPEQDRIRVVDRFVRLEKSRTRTGSGLGLSLVHAIMKLHQGELLLEDNSPGLKITLKLPIYKPDSKLASKES